MKMLKRRIASLVAIAFTGLALLACTGLTEPGVVSVKTREPYADAQSTLDSGEDQLEDLSDQADEVSLDMADAAATQAYLTEQTRVAGNAQAAAQSEAATAQSQAATAAAFAYYQNATRTAQAQAEQDAQGTQIAQANATQAAYSLTATPLAALLAADAQRRDAAEQKAWWAAYIFNPLKAALLTLLVFLLIVVGVILGWRMIPVLENFLRPDSRNDHEHSLLMVDGEIVDPNTPAPPIRQRVLRLLRPARSPGSKTPRVEIIAPTEPAIINWITEAELKLQSGGGARP